MVHPNASPSLNLHQVLNGDYTISHDDSSHELIHQRPNGGYAVSCVIGPDHVNHHYKTSGDYTVPWSKGTTSYILSRPYLNNHQTPNGDYTVSHVNQISDSDFLSACRPVNIQDSVLSQIRRMIARMWPEITPTARCEDPAFAKIYDAVKSFNVPNFAGARIPIASGLKVQNWATLLRNYHDNELCQFLQFGWPLGYYSDIIPKSATANHPSALAYPDHIADFIQTELSFKALTGPFEAPPFTPWFRVSPLMTRPKKGSNKRRVIVDLSYPEGVAVNSGIDIQQYLGRDISYSLPTIMDLVSKLQIEGKGAYVWKADLARAYRQLRADPLDAPLLGIAHNAIYIDRCPPFGCRSSSAACQRVANALVYSLANNQHHCLAYLDDFAGCNSSLDRAKAGFKAFIDLADYLGLQLSLDKCVPPARDVEWLGYRIDTMQMTISIPDVKLAEVLQECHRWFSRKRVTRTMVQSLAGKLSHIAGCVQHGRKFLTRILGALRADATRKWLTVDDEFLKDVRWFYLYAEAANGISLYSPSIPQLTIECDSSLLGAGGNTDAFCYTWQYTKHHTERFPVIHQMEAVNILVAYRTLAHCQTPSPLRVLILTDNISSSAALMTGRSKDTVLAACARELWLEAAKHDDLITIEHRPGTSIPLADALSRMAVDTSKSAYVTDTVMKRKLTFVPPVLQNYHFFDSDL